MTAEDPYPAWRATLAAVLEHWDGVQAIEEGWTVEYDAGDGAYRATFTLRPNVFPGTKRRRYSFTEAEFCQYVLGVADLAPEKAGPAALRLAEESREEAP